jgi:bifunctional DNase/RNase
MPTIRLKKSMRRRGVIGLAVLFWLWCAGAVYAEFKSEDNLQVTVQRLSVDSKNKQPVVALTDANQSRVLFIWIGFFEASAIYSEMEGIEPPRPLTHDLLQRIIQNTDGKLERIVITHIESNTYYATIFLKKNGQLIEIDARPSDSIVMALKFDAPIFVSKVLFEAMAVPLVDPPDVEQKYGMTLQDLTVELAEYLSFESTRGVFVSGVQKKGQAEKDGLEVGDIIVAAEGSQIEDLQAIRAALVKGSGPLELKIFRQNHYTSLTLHRK